MNELDLRTSALNVDSFDLLIRYTFSFHSANH